MEENTRWVCGGETGKCLGDKWMIAFMDDASRLHSLLRLLCYS